MVGLCCFAVVHPAQAVTRSIPVRGEVKLIEARVYWQGHHSSVVAAGKSQGVTIAERNHAVNFPMPKQAKFIGHVANVHSQPNPGCTCNTLQPAIVRHVDRHVPMRGVMPAVAHHSMRDCTAVPKSDHTQRVFLSAAMAARSGVQETVASLAMALDSDKNVVSE
jgi:hypothetical protein